MENSESEEYADHAYGTRNSRKTKPYESKMDISNTVNDDNQDILSEELLVSPEPRIPIIRIEVPRTKLQLLSSEQVSQARDRRTTSLLCRLRLFKLLSHVRAGVKAEELEIIRFHGQAKQLSVYVLFVEVLSRGGSTKVSADRKWAEVATTLNVFFTHNGGSILKGKYEEAGLAIVEHADTNLVEEFKDFGSQEAGARQASLPPRAMTPIEVSVFPSFANKILLREKYLLARNHVLQRWCLICDRAIDFGHDILKPLELEFPSFLLSEYPLKEAFFAMETLGFMNWGCLDKSNFQSHFVGGERKKFIVVGAGLAGLACALQLSKFGHDVTIIEGRNRVGGRVHTDCQTFSAPVDLGAMLITGVQGHPASVLTHQLRQRKYAVGDACPIYSLGELLNPAMDAKVEARFNDMLTAAAVAARSVHLPPQESNQVVRAVKENTRQRGRVNQFLSISQPGRLNHPHSKFSGVVWNSDTKKWKTFLTTRSSGKFEFSRIEHEDEISAALQHDNNLMQKENPEDYSDSKNQELFPNDFKDKSTTTNSDCLQAVPNVEEQLTQLNNSRKKIKEMKKFPPIKDDFSLLERMMNEETKQYDTEDARKLEETYLSWHFANLEYACATSLARISAANWDQDDEHDWEGSHVMLPNGFGLLTEGMRRYFMMNNRGTVHLGKTVAIIQNTENGSKVICEDGEEFTADAVVCTVSLGILKSSSIKFEPPLPSWKVGAISRLGYGNLNKVVFEFDRIFWNENHDIFGRVVHPHVGSRGECYMFWALNRLNPYPIILALCAGDAADEQEYRTDDVVSSRALDALKETFPNEVIPIPKSCVVTRWRSDRFSRGTYSFVGVGSSGEDYNLMAESVGNIFFAGEATCREHPATTGKTTFRTVDFSIG